jgi:hypothetical protein
VLSSGATRPWPRRKPLPPADQLSPLPVLLYNSLAMQTNYLPFLVLAVLLTSPILGDVSPARISFVEGTAAVAHAGEEEWAEAGLNLPIYEGDRLVLQEDSRAELEFDDGSFLRLGPNSDLTFRRFAGDGMEFKLMLGTIILRAASAAWTVYTDPLAVALREPGLYRLDVDEEASMRLVVRKGRADVSGTLSTSVRGGQSLSVEVPGQHWISQTYLKDEFDFWSDRRDARTVARQSAAQLGGHYAGLHELDRYGDWGYHASYGVVWWPHVAYGWSPFRMGRWVHYSRWGWTWISHEPWGWLPYHRGRWAYLDSFGRWCWVPGYLNTWSPAVAHFYFGKGFVGWAPRTPDNHWASAAAGGSFGRGLGRAGFSMVREEDFARGVIPDNRFVQPTSDLLSALTPGMPVVRAGQSRGMGVPPAPNQPPGGRVGRAAGSPAVSNSSVPASGPNIVRIPRESATPSRAVRVGSGVLTLDSSGNQSAPGMSPPNRFGSRPVNSRLDRGAGPDSGAAAAGPVMRSPSRGVPSGGTVVPGHERRMPFRTAAPGVRQSSPSRTASPAGRGVSRITVPQAPARPNTVLPRMENSRRAR